MHIIHIYKISCILFNTNTFQVIPFDPQMRHLKIIPQCGLGSYSNEAYATLSRYSKMKIHNQT